LKGAGLESTSWWTVYDDRFGNRWQQNGPNSFIATFTGNIPGNPQNNNRMDGYSYDAAGNLLNDGSHTYFYDAESRIIQVGGTLGTCSTATACYVYDANGQRIRKTTGSTSVDYLYDLAGHEIVEVSATGVWNRAEIYAGGRHLATYASGSGGTTYFNHADWLGTERMRTSMSAASCETITSLPFGDGQATSGSCGDPSPMHFTGKERDSESGLDNFGARYFASSMGRFMIPDWSTKPTDVPYGVFTDPETLNLYAYTRNNPLSRKDLDGHCGAPSGLRAGQVGICIASYIEYKTIFRYGRGDGRAPDPHGGTSRIETRLTVTPQEGTNSHITKTSEHVGRSGILFKDVGLQGSGQSTIGNNSTDKEGNTHFQVSQHASSAMSLKGLLFGDIDNHINLEVTKDQKVGIESGSTAKDYPSIEVFSYTVDSNGKVTEKLIMWKEESGDARDLKKEEKPLPATKPI
jgi:RHS repeat-associated protein